MYYFRDSAGNEVDLIVEKEEHPMAIEIKAGTKFNESMLRGLKYWQKYQPKSHSILLFGGSTHTILNEKMSVLPWSQIEHL